MSVVKASSVAIAAIAFALFYTASLFGPMDLPEGGYSDQQVIATYAESGKRFAAILGVYLLAAAGLAFLWFLASLCDVLRRADGQLSRLPRLAFAGGLVYCVMLFSAGAAFGALPGAVAFGDVSAESIDPGIARVLVNLGFGLLLIYGLLGAAIMVLAASLGAQRSGALPRWLAWAGLPVAGLLLLGPVYLPQLLVPLWAVAVGIALARRPVTVA